MGKMEKYLLKKGYETINEDYPSTQFSIEKIAEVVMQDIIVKRCNDSQAVIHFVTHSLGGIIVRYLLTKNKIYNLGRVVMLAPPNDGSEVADWLENNYLYKRFLGPAGQELGTGNESIPKRLGPVKFQVGIIAGNRSINPINSLVINKPNDGKVAVERTKVEGMLDFLVVSRPHPLIMNCKEVMFQTEHFLRKGYFLR